MSANHDEAQYAKETHFGIQVENLDFPRFGKVFGRRWAVKHVLYGQIETTILAMQHAYTPPLCSSVFAAKHHIDHIAKVAGIDHVGLGSDFDGVSGATPQGIDTAADLPRITQALLDREYSADDIRKILGGNLLRVFREAERISREMQALK